MCYYLPDCTQLLGTDTKLSSFVNASSLKSGLTSDEETPDEMDNSYHQSLPEKLNPKEIHLTICVKMQIYLIRRSSQRFDYT